MIPLVPKKIKPLITEDGAEVAGEILAEVAGEILPPNQLSANSQPLIAPPNTLAPISISTTSSLANARIGWDNKLIEVTTLTGTPPAENAVAVLIPNTYERFRINGAGSRWLLFNMAELTEIDFFAIGGQTIGNGEGNIVTLWTATTLGGTYTYLNSITMVGDKPFMLLFPAMDVMQIRMSIGTASGGNTLEGSEIAYISAGKTLEMQRGIYGGHAPMDLNEKNNTLNVKSERGQFLGRTQTQIGSKTLYKWKHLTPEWYRLNFQPFVKSAKKTPFFIMWRPDTYNDTAFGVTTGDIKPSNMTGGARFLEVSFNMKAAT